MGFKTCLNLSVLLLTSAALAGCQNPERKDTNKFTGWGGDAAAKGGSPPPNFPRLDANRSTGLQPNSLNPNYPPNTGGFTPTGGQANRFAPGGQPGFNPPTGGGQPNFGTPGGFSGGNVPGGPGASGSLPWNPNSSPPGGGATPAWPPTGGAGARGPGSVPAGPPTPGPFAPAGPSLGTAPGAPSPGFGIDRPPSTPGNLPEGFGNMPSPPPGFNRGN